MSAVENLGWQMGKAKRGCVPGGQSGKTFQTDQARNGSTSSAERDKSGKHKSLETEDRKAFRISCSGVFFIY